MRTFSLLVVDDQVSNFDVIEALLGSSHGGLDSGHSYQFHYADSGESALNSLSVIFPDLILLDVMMPGMDGFEVCRRLKSMP